MFDFDKANVIQFCNIAPKKLKKVINHCKSKQLFLSYFFSYLFELRFYIFAGMELKDIIKAKGLKNEYLIERTGINRNKFYKALKTPAILSDTELTRLAELLNLKVETLTDLTK